MENLFKHSLPIQLRFNDVDALGHINNSVYLNFYDLGKTSYFQTICGETLVPSDIDVVVAHIEVDFLSPIFLTDAIEVQTTVEKIGNKSFTLLQRIVCCDTEQVKCICRTVMVGFDLKTNESKPISDRWRNAIIQYENRNDLI